MLSVNVIRRAGVSLVATMLLAFACLQPSVVQAQGLDFKAVCSSYPAGIKRAGCLQDMGIKQAMIDAREKGVTMAPQQVAGAMATLSLQAVLALDATIREWQSLGEWAWTAGAHRPSFHAIDAMGGEHRPAQSMPCPGGGSIGLVDNAGGETMLTSQHTLPFVDVAFEKGCRSTAGGPSVTAVAPDVEYATQFSVPDEQGKQLLTHPMFLQFNSQPRLSSMPAWVPQGTAGELKVEGGRLKLYGETPTQSERGLSFTFWPQSAHAVDHRPYAGVSLRVDAKTPGVGAANCIAGGRRCLMLDTRAAAPDRVEAHFDLSGSAVAGPQAPPPSLYVMRIAVNTEQPLALDEVNGRPVLASGRLVLHSTSVLHAANGQPGATWDIVVTPAMVGGKRMLHVDWKRSGGGEPDRSGTQDLPQSAAVSLPHYCAVGEKGWGCVATDYDPDYDM